MCISHTVTSQCVLTDWCLRGELTDRQNVLLNARILQLWWFVVCSVFMFIDLMLSDHEGAQELLLHTTLHSADNITFCRPQYILQITLHSAWPHYILQIALHYAWPHYILHGHITFYRPRYILQTTVHSTDHITFCVAILHSADHITFCMATLHSAFCKDNTMQAIFLLSTALTLYVRNS